LKGKWDRVTVNSNHRITVVTIYRHAEQSRALSFFAFSFFQLWPNKQNPIFFILFMLPRTFPGEHFFASRERFRVKKAKAWLWLSSLGE
jgi:hypothetical protein